MQPMAKKNSSKSAMTKSDVIRSMPNASAGDIIKKAKSVGLELTANHVYAVRAIDKRRGRPARLGGGPPTTAPNRSPRGRSKTAFIRAFTRDTPAATVVAEAKRAGVKISKAYVYRVRALETPVVQQPAKLGRRLGNRADSRPDPRSEQRLTSLALEIGLMRANLLLDRVRARLGQ
jgi:hypothetical protein